MWAPNSTKWLYIGAPFTIGVAGLIIYLNVAGAEQVPRVKFEAEDNKVSEAHWPGEKALYVCGSPDWVHGNIDEAVKFVGGLGITYTSVHKTEGPCSGFPEVLTCDYAVKGEAVRELDCVPGGIVLTLADGGYNFGTMEDGGHGDETKLSLDWRTGDISNVTGLFPADLEDIKALRINEDDEFEESDWPMNAELLVVIHSLIHADGFDHVLTPLGCGGAIYAEPTGHIMARDIGKLGMDTAGL